MSTPSIAERDPTVWMDGDPQPGREVDTVRDVDGDIWERLLPDDDRYPDVWSPEADPEVVLTWDELTKEFSQVTDATNEPAGATS